MCRRVAWSGQSTDQDRVIDPGMLGQAKESWMHWIFGIGAVTRGTRVRDATSTLPGPPLLVQTCSERVNTTLAAGGARQHSAVVQHSRCCPRRTGPPSVEAHPSAVALHVPLFPFEHGDCAVPISAHRCTSASAGCASFSARFLPAITDESAVAGAGSAALCRHRRAGRPHKFLADVRYQLWHLGQSNQLAGSSLWSQPALLLCWQSAVVK